MSAETYYFIVGKADGTATISTVQADAGTAERPEDWATLIREVEFSLKTSGAVKYARLTDEFTAL